MNNHKRGLILLNMLQDIGPIRLKALLARFKSPEAIFNAPAGDLRKVEGIGPKAAESISAAKSGCDLDRELSLIKEHGINITTIFDKGYPANLAAIYDAPFVMYSKGEFRRSGKFAIAIVGSRRCSLYGVRMAQELASELAGNGITVVSGLARGIDTAAHKGAIKAGGETIAVLGNGLASVYPPENKRLADEIRERGAVASEFPMDMPPHRINFPRRNRVISGLSDGVVVVEAGRRSGSLITADFALSEGRDVFAVPGAVGSLASEGTNNLIKEGAKLVESAKDILESFGVSPQKQDKNNLKLDNPMEARVYDMLSDKPCGIDTIMGALLLEPKPIKTLLLGMELRGIIKQLPGKMYVKAVHAR